MFKSLDRHGDDHAPTHGGARAPAAALAHDQVIDGGSRNASTHAGLRARIETWCAQHEIAPDLACDIGSRKWFRGLATLFGLGAAAVAMWPDFTSVEAAVPMRVEAREREEFRSQSIAPLALGADSGRRMGTGTLVHPLAAAPERPSLELVSTLGRGDSFGRMLKRAGLATGDVDRVTQLVSQAMDPAQIESGTQFDITLGRRPSPDAPRVLDGLGFRARFDLDLAVERSDSGLMLVRHPIAVDETPLRIRGTVGSSLYRAARNAGAPVSAIRSYLQAIDRFISLESDVRSGDEFDMILAYKRSAKGERQAGELLYAGIEREGKPKLQLLRWGDRGEMYSASSIDSPRAVPIGQPVAGRVTSRYGMRRHPILGYKRMHAGLDFGASHGSPIYAVADGRVTYSGRHGGHGNYVRLQHSGGLGTGYAHMSRIAVSNGARVKAGQVIGYVGSTGLSTGPHLHLEAYRNGRTVDPQGIRIVTQPQITGKDRARFRSRMESLLTVEPGAALGDMALPEDQQGEDLREIDRLSPKSVG